MHKAIISTLILVAIQCIVSVISYKISGDVSVLIDKKEKYIRLDFKYELLSLEKVHAAEVKYLLCSLNEIIPDKIKNKLNGFEQFVETIAQLGLDQNDYQVRLEMNSGIYDCSVNDNIINNALKKINAKDFEYDLMLRSKDTEMHAYNLGKELINIDNLISEMKRNIYVLNLLNLFFSSLIFLMSIYFTVSASKKNSSTGSD